MDSFPIHKNEQSTFVTQFLCRSIEEQIKKTDVLSHLYMLTNCFPIDKAPECRSSMEACRVQTKKTGMCANNNKKQVSWTNNSKVLMCTGTSMTQWPFQGSTLIPHWPFCGVLPLPFTCYCLSTPRGHWSENKSFSKKCLCGFPSVHVSVLTLHKQLLYWLWTRPGGSAKHYWRVPGTSRQSQFHLPQQKSQSSSYWSSLPSSAERAHYSSGGFYVHTGVLFHSHPTKTQTAHTHSCCWTDLLKLLIKLHQTLIPNTCATYQFVF